MIRLGHQLCHRNPSGQLGVWSDGVGHRIPQNLGYFDRRVDEVGLELNGRVDGRGTFEPVGKEKLGVIFMYTCDENFVSVSTDRNIAYLLLTLLLVGVGDDEGTRLNANGVLIFGG